MAGNGYVPSFSREELLGGTNNQDTKYTPTISRNDLLLGAGISQEKIDQDDFEYNRDDDSSFGTALLNEVKGVVRAPISAVEGLVNLNRGQNQRLRSEYLVKNEGYSQEDADRIAAQEYPYADWSDIRNSDLLRPEENKAPSRKYFKNFALDVVKSAPQVAAQVGVTAATGGLGGAAFMGFQIAGGSYEGLINEGVDPERAIKAGLVKAVVQTPMELLATGKWLGKGKGSKLTNFADIIGTEAATEGLQEYPEAAAHLWAKSPDKSYSEMAQSYVDNLDETTKDALYSGLIGGTFGLVGGAGNLAANRNKGSNNSYSLDYSGGEVNYMVGPESSGRPQFAMPGEHFDIQEGVNWEGVASLEKAGIQSLIWEYNQRYPEDRITVTDGLRAPNAAYGSETSFHNAGKGVDLWSEGIMNDPEKRNWLVNRAREMGFREVLDEVSDPSERATGPHFHIADFQGDIDNLPAASFEQNYETNQESYDYSQEESGMAPIGELRMITEPEAVHRSVVDDTRSFSTQLDRWENGKMGNEIIRMGATPDVLTMLGANQLPVEVSQKILQKIKNRHGIGIETLKQLPAQLADPWMVFESKTKDNGMVVFTTLQDSNNKEIMAAIHLDALHGRKNRRVNAIASVYGKDTTSNFIKSNIKDSKLRYLNTKKNQSALQSRGLQLPKEVTTIDSFDSILTEKDFAFNKDFQQENPRTAQIGPARSYTNENGTVQKNIAPVNPDSIQSRYNLTNEYTGETTSRKKFNDMLHRFSDIPIRYGRLGKRAKGKNAKGTLGWNDGQRGVIRVGKVNDWETLTHEVGHSLDAKLGVSENESFKSELERWTHQRYKGKPPYSRDQWAKEGAAEFWRQFLTNQKAAQQNFPTVFKEVSETLQANPEVMKGLQEIEAEMTKWVNMTPEQRAMGSISYGEDGGSFKEFLSSPMGKFRQWSEWFSDNFIDVFFPVFRMEKDFEKRTGVKLRDEQSPTLQIRTYRGVMDMAEANMLDGIIRKDGTKSASLREVLKIVGKDRKEFSSYLLARRELNMYDIERQTGELFNGHTLTEAEAKKIVSDNQSNHRFQSALLKLRDFQNALVELLVEKGVVKEADYQAMKTKWPDYVPMYRDMDTGIDSDLGSRFSSKSLVHGSTPIQKMKGSTRDVIDPLESIIKNTVLYTTRAKANEVLQSIVNVADYDGTAVLVEEVSGSSSQTENVIPVFFEGEKKYFQVTPEVYSAVKAMNTETPNAIVNGIGVVETVLRGSATIYNPTFVLTNFPRDFVAASINATHGFNPKIAIRGIESFLKQDENYWAWKRSGGGNSLIATVNRNDYQNMLNELAGKDWSQKSTWESIKNGAAFLAEITEAGVRVGVYMNEKAQGASDIKAAVESRDATVDFARKGKKMTPINKMAAFSNAFVQGMNIAYRTTKNHPKATAKSVGALAAFSVGLALLQGDDERYKEAMRRDKDRYWYIIPSALMGDALTEEKIQAEMKKGKTREEVLSEYQGGWSVFRIPKPQIYGTVFVSSAERVFQRMRGDERALDGWKESLMDELTPNITPLLFKIPFEYASGYDTFRNKDTVPLSLQGEHPVDQYTWKTSEFAKKVGRLTGESPMKIDHALNSFGGLSSDALIGLDRLLAEENKRPALNPGEYYGVRRLMSEPFSYSQSIDDFYSDYYDQDKMAKHFKATQEEMEGFDKGYYGQLKSYKKSMDAAVKHERIVRDDPKLSAEQKRSELDKLNLIKLEIAKKALKKTGRQ